MITFPNQAARHLEYPELTMYDMISRMAEAYPQEPAYEFYNRKTNYRTMLAGIDRAAQSFAAIGVRPGDPVTICLPNVPMTIDAFYALDKMGAVASMIHPLSAETEITYYLNYAKSSWIVTLDMFYEKVRTAADKADHPVMVIVARMQDALPVHLRVLYTAKAGKNYLKYPPKTRQTGEPGNQDILWSDFLRLKYDGTVEKAEFERYRTSVILYSGGTTGQAKGICLTDLNFNALGLQAVDFIGETFCPGYTMLSCMPMFHGFGLGINIHTVLIHGACCILLPTFTIDSYAKMLIKKKPNYIAGVPTIFDALLNAKALDGLDMSFLRGMFCGGDTLHTELKRRVDAFLKEHKATIEIREGYGLTECVTASCLTPKDGYRPHSIGLPFADTVYDIVQPGTDESLPPDTEGEIVLKGPTMMTGYLYNDEETALALRMRNDGDIWLYTGDLGHMDKDGYVYFSQRMKRMIITNGYNVYPTRLENAIDCCDIVDLSCVIGIQDQRRGQRVKAYVVLKDGVKESEEAKTTIMDHLSKLVAAYALPKEIEFRKELPKTLVGKVAYRVLEEEVRAQMAAEEKAV
ncbi:MAG: acyl--CoA ligase [Mogibacterium sp.]|nr:acyl--CoA ligase [Mogibacterium sp.]